MQLRGGYEPFVKPHPSNSFNNIVLPPHPPVHVYINVRTEGGTWSLMKTTSAFRRVGVCKQTWLFPRHSPGKTRDTCLECLDSENVSDPLPTSILGCKKFEMYKTPSLGQLSRQKNKTRNYTKTLFWEGGAKMYRNVTPSPPKPKF